ncbi:hypothetical protein [Clostridium muellerianum]|nr:hypothetical protein [Clostridium muellerianum]
MSDDFYYVEGNSSVKDIIKSIIKEITQKAGTYAWSLVYPNNTDAIKDYALISTKNLYCDKVFYTKFERSAATIPTGNEQKLIDKYNNSKPLTTEQYNLMKRYIGSLDIGKITGYINNSYYSESNVLKKESGMRTDDENTFTQFVRTVRNITDDAEITLIYKYLNGIALNTSEQNQYQVFKEAHELTSSEINEWTKLKKDRKFYSDSIVIILLKEYLMPDLLSNSDRSSLASYRQSIELTDLEMQQLARLKAGMDNRNNISISIGTEIEDKQVMQNENGKQQQITIKDLVEDKSSLPARFAWYRNLDSSIGDWLPLQFWITQNKDSINIVLRGDPSADNYPYNNYLTSWAHIGALKPVRDGAYTDDVYNFGVCTSSDLEPQYIPKFGSRTGTGITDFVMVGNKIGMPYQPHYAAHYTTNQWMDKCNFNGSRWNMNKHTFDNITVVHPVDMERGILQNVMVGDATAINDTDRLVYEADGVEEWYRKFKINAPYSLFTNGPNVLYCIAIRIPKSDTN